ncbi:hypothetical protein E1264_33945, partial [Actinomadura sp. KC216]
LSQGGLLVSGTPAEIQADPRVLEEYTGSKAAVPGNFRIRTVPASARIGDSRRAMLALIKNWSRRFGSLLK